MATHVGTDCVSPGNVSAIGIPWPAGAAVGDQAILFVVTSTGTTEITDTDLSTWTSLVRCGSAFYVHVWTKTLTAAESGTLTLTLGSQNRASGAITLLRGANAVTAADVAWTATTDPPSVTRTGTRVAICAITERASSGLSTAYTAPAGFTLADASYLTGSGATNLAVAHLMTDDPDGTVDPAAWGRDGTTTTYISITVAVPVPASTTSVTSTTATTYAVRAQVTSTSATTWMTRARVTSTTATTWAARTTATSTTSTTWAVRARVASTTATTYPVRARITSSTATGWAARAVVTSTTATGWAARVSVTSTTATTWNVLADSPPGTVTSTTSTTWPVRAQTTSTSATTWATRAAITSTTTTAYLIRSRTTSTTSTTWAARARVAATGGTTWPARGSVSAAGSTTWAARSRLVSLTLTEWAALAHVTSTASATWAIASEAARDVMVLSILWRPRRVRVVAARAGTDITEHRRATVERGARP